MGQHQPLLTIHSNMGQDTSSHSSFNSLHARLTRSGIVVNSQPRYGTRLLVDGAEYICLGTKRGTMELQEVSRNSTIESDAEVLYPIPSLTNMRPAQRCKVMSTSDGLVHIDWRKGRAYREATVPIHDVLPLRQPLTLPYIVTTEVSTSPMKRVFKTLAF